MQQVMERCIEQKAALRVQLRGVEEELAGKKYEIEAYLEKQPSCDATKELSLLVLDERMPITPAHTSPTILPELEHHVVSLSCVLSGLFMCIYK
jgi:hypothetical protein